MYAPRARPARRVSCPLACGGCGCEGRRAGPSREEGCCWHSSPGDGRSCRSTPCSDQAPSPVRRCACPSRPSKPAGWLWWPPSRRWSCPSRRGSAPCGDNVPRWPSISGWQYPWRSARQCRHRTVAFQRQWP